MRIKKGFTLAEILIVLMVIGVIATMTIPSLMKGVTEQQWKTAYNKAYNTISNMAAMERVSGGLPAKGGTVGMSKMFEAMNASLSVREYVGAANAVNSGTTINNSDYKTSATFAAPNGGPDNTYGAGNDAATGTNGTQSPWIITEDNLAYTLLPAGTTTDVCRNKATILAETSVNNMIQDSCAIVVVDVNGLTAGPNVVEPQIGQDLNGQPMTQLSGDQFYIYVGIDGATSGNKVNTVTGRITAGMK